MQDMKAILVRSQKGDKEAFAQLYGLVYKDLYKYALYTLGNQQDAEDVVSETVTEAYVHIRDLRDVQAFKGWIFRILSNKCKRKMRSYYEKQEELVESSASYEHDLGQSYDIQRAFAKLNEEERKIVTMSAYEGYNSREIGNELRLKESTVRSKLKRGLFKMRQELETNLEGGLFYE